MQFYRENHYAFILTIGRNDIRRCFFVCALILLTDALKHYCYWKQRRLINSYKTVDWFFVELTCILPCILYKRVWSLCGGHMSSCGHKSFFCSNRAHSASNMKMHQDPETSQLRHVDVSIETSNGKSAIYAIMHPSSTSFHVYFTFCLYRYWYCWKLCESIMVWNGTNLCQSVK